ncbi:MAG: hypothetical protein SGI92_10640 [Bryobacteraceae bacterium]|nr:hypothetical protein [Bryobacteraceae bacterium]
MTKSDTVNSKMFSCDAARRRTLSYREGHLPADEMELMRRHLRQCPECAEESGPVAELRRNLRAVPPPAMPPSLKMKLRVTASQQAARRRTRRNAVELIRTWAGEIRLWTDNLMRPLALPTAGGFASALVLFSVFSFGLETPLAKASRADVPTGLYTEASVKNYLPLGLHDSDIVVELTIDDQGRVVDYALPAMSAPLSMELRRNIENNLLFTQFNPATSFGQPTAGKVRLWFRSSHIDVKG